MPANGLVRCRAQGALLRIARAWRRARLRDWIVRMPVMIKPPAAAIAKSTMTTRKVLCWP